MVSEKNRFRTIILSAVVSIIFFIAALILLFISILNKNENNSNYSIASLICGILCAVFSVFGSLHLLFFSWETKWCEKNQVLWGLLSLFLIFFVGLIIFYSIGKKHYK